MGGWGSERMLNFDNKNKIIIIQGMIDTILSEKALRDIDIVVKCKKYPEFRKQLEEIEKQYSFDHNMSNLHDPRENRRTQIFRNYYEEQFTSISTASKWHPSLMTSLIRCTYCQLWKMDDYELGNFYHHTGATPQEIHPHLLPQHVG